MFDSIVRLFLGSWKIKCFKKFPSRGAYIIITLTIPFTTRSNVFHTLGMLYYAPARTQFVEGSWGEVRRTFRVLIRADGKVFDMWYNIQCTCTCVYNLVR